MENMGYVMVYRKLLLNPVVNKNPDHLSVWIYLLMNATHREREVHFGGEIVTLSCGELVTGRRKIASEQRISESKVQRILKTFEIEQLIEQRSDHQCRIISILNWSIYQNSEQRNEQRVNNERTTTPKKVNTHNNDIYKNDKNKEIRDTAQSSDELCAVPPPEALVFSLILNDKSEYPITQSQIDKWTALYPSVDVPSEIRKMIGWCDANPQRRKTAKGVLRFVNGWLAKEQDKGGKARASPEKKYDRHTYELFLD
jgi:hypothetical protein